MEEVWAMEMQEFELARSGGLRRFSCDALALCDMYALWI